MILKLPRRCDYLFRFKNESEMNDFTRKFFTTRKNLGKRLCNPRLVRISLKTLRHWKTTMEYHRTKDILYVKELLGHKNIQNTLVYTHLVSWENDDYTVRVGSTIEECTKLLEAGFEYVTDFEEKKLFRKKK